MQGLANAARSALSPALAVRQGIRANLESGEQFDAVDLGEGGATIGHDIWEDLVRLVVWR
jgi:hypothetical protein